jgi:hypothetical protein
LLNLTSKNKAFWNKLSQLLDLWIIVDGKGIKTTTNGKYRGNQKSSIWAAQMANAKCCPMQKINFCKHLKFNVSLASYIICNEIVSSFLFLDYNNKTEISFKKNLKLRFNF